MGLVPSESTITVPSNHFVIDSPDLRPLSADMVTQFSDDSSISLWTSGERTQPWLSVQATLNAGEPYVFPNSSRRTVLGVAMMSP